MIELGFILAVLLYGLKVKLYWDYVHFPHILCIGSTGSGKTYFCKLLLGRIGLKMPDAVVTICDFKNDDFSFLEGCHNYYGYMRCKEGFDAFFEMFTNRQNETDANRDFRMLFFDEWASFLNTLDKKEAEAYKAKLATLLMLGRSFNVHVMISQQRADASYFSTARDNFSVIVALGNLSKESKAMFFGDFKDEMRICNIGEGHVLFNGARMEYLTVPTVRNEAKMLYYIREALG